MANNRLYGFWGDLEEALLTGKPQNEQKHSERNNQFADIYSSQEKMKEFLAAMAGIQLGEVLLLRSLLSGLVWMRLKGRNANGSILTC